MLEFEILSIECRVRSRATVERLGRPVASFETAASLPGLD